MIALASSVKLVMTESCIIDTIMNGVIELLSGKSKFLAIVLIYFLILFLQFFIGSASAKIILVMPIIMPIAIALGLSPALVILAYCMADGFSDVIIPTNPILLVGLSMTGVSYGKWFKWTWKLQLLIFTLSIAFLGFGVLIGY
ncbi:MAG: AbgT family transporter, partial [Clostridia bacterium]|nr:AbgT family transporter [Clostridia bacterium]